MVKPEEGIEYTNELTDSERNPLLSIATSSDTKPHTVAPVRHRQRLWISRVLSVLLLFAVFAMITTFLVRRSKRTNDDGDDDDDNGTDDNTYVVYTEGTYESCVDFDDDSTFTAEVCEKYDWSQCYEHETPCSSSYWCLEFCSSACEDGTGALCYFSTLSDLKSTCSIVKKRIEEGDGSTDLPINGKSVRFEQEELVSKRSTESGYGLHDDINDEGCFVHSFCEYCTGSCRTKILSYVENRFNDTTAIAVDTPGASVERYKDAVIDIVATCKHFGYSV
jgi:hypothetical protein